MIQPTYGVLQNLFADRVFRIPHYQRFYSWQSRQRQDLFSDLRKLASQGEDQHHFMATVVWFAHRRRKPSERINTACTISLMASSATTLIILLNASSWPFL